MCDFDHLTPICSPRPGENQTNQRLRGAYQLHGPVLRDDQCGVLTKDRGSGPPAAGPVYTVSLPESPPYPRIPHSRTFQDVGEDRTVCGRG